MRDVRRTRVGSGPVARVLRASLLVVGVGAMTAAFLGFIDEQLTVVGAAPWWYLGVAGVVATLLGLGSPWGP
jgi:hypothetical protein